MASELRGGKKPLKWHAEHKRGDWTICVGGEWNQEVRSGVQKASVENDLTENQDRTGRHEPHQTYDAKIKNVQIKLN